MSQSQRPHGPRMFTKPALGSAEQIALLQEQGLCVPDQEWASRYPRQDVRQALYRAVSAGGVHSRSSWMSPGNRSSISSTLTRLRRSRPY